MLAFAMSAPGADRAVQWHELRSEHFYAITDGSVKKAERALKKLEKFRHLLSVVMPTLRLDPPIPTTVIFFRGKKSIRPYVRLGPDGQPQKWAGFMQPGRERMYLAVVLSGSQSQQTTFHEYIHLIFQLTGGDFPVWLNEGLAEFYENTELLDKRFRIGIPDVGWWHLLRRTKLIPMDVFQAVDHSSPYYNVEEQRHLFYAQAWVTIQYFMLGEKGTRQPELALYMSLIQRGMSPTDAFARAIHGDGPALRKKLAGYIRKGQSSFFQGDLDEKYVPRPIQSAPISSISARAQAADLWINSGRWAEAETALRKLAAEGQPSHEVLYRQGRVAMRQQRAQEAREFFEAALEIEPMHLSSRYFAAVAWMESGLPGGGDANQTRETADRIVDLLTPVVEGSSDFDHAQELLISAHRMRGDGAAEYLPLVEQIWEAGSDRPWIGFTLAATYAELDRWDDVEKVVNQLAGFVQGARWESQLKTWQDTLQRRQEWEKREAECAAGDGRCSPASHTNRARSNDPVEPTPVAAQPAKVAFVKGILEEIVCEGDTAVLTVKPLKGDRRLRLRVRSLDRLLVMGARTEDEKSICGARGKRVGINYKVASGEASEADLDGSVFTLEFNAPEL